MDAEDTFEKMKDTLDTIIKLYGTEKIRYAVITFGSAASVIVNFGDDRSKDELRAIVDLLKRPSGDPDITNLLKQTERLFKDAPSRPGSKKVLVVFLDKKSTNSRGDIKEATQPLFENNVTIVPAVVGPEVYIDEIDVMVENKGKIAVCWLPKPDTWPNVIIDKIIEG